MQLCKLKLDQEKSKHASLGKQKWFWPNIFAKFAGAGKRHSKAEHLLKKSVIIMTSLDSCSLFLIGQSQFI
jgi:hypothetical protein